MAVNWLDQSQVDNFRTTAIDRGIDSNEIDSYISSKKPGQSVQPVKLDSQVESIQPMNDTMAKSNIASLQPMANTTEPVGMPMAQPQQGNGTITQAFGNPNAGLYGRDKNGRANINRGVDIATPAGTPQSAPSSGKWVVESAYNGNGFNTGWGRSVVIKNTQTGETIRRSHLDKVMVKPGEVVTGKALGTTGRSGRTTGYHQDVEYTDPNGKLADFTKSQYY